jgi:hypothetical protein
MNITVRILPVINALKEEGMRLFTYRLMQFILAIVISLVGIAQPVGAATPSAVLSIVPPSGSYTTGETFTVDVRLDTGGQPVTVIGVVIQYSNLEFVNAIDTGSVFNGPIKEPKPGVKPIEIERFRADDGYNGTDGLVLKLVFKSTQAGTGSVTIDQSKSEVIHASDNVNPNILKSVNNGSYTLAAPQPQATATPAPTPTPTPTPAVSTSNVKNISNAASETEAAITFQTTIKAKATIYYGTKSAVDAGKKLATLSKYPSKVTEDVDSTSHSLTIKDLSGGKKYYYTVALSNGAQEPERVFTTLGAAATPAPTASPAPSATPVPVATLTPVATEEGSGLPLGELLIPAIIVLVGVVGMIAAYIYSKRQKPL